MRRFGPQNAKLVRMLFKVVNGFQVLTLRPVCRSPFHRSGCVRPYCFMPHLFGVTPRTPSCRNAYFMDFEECFYSPTRWFSLGEWSNFVSTTSRILQIACGTVPILPRSSLDGFISPPQETPELEGALSEQPPAETDNVENDESKENSDSPPEVTVGEQEGSGDVDGETPTGLEEGGEEKASSGGADGEEEVRHNQTCFL